MSIPEGGSTSVSAVSRDVDEARALGGQIYYPHSVRVLGDSQQFSMRLDAAEMGPVTMGWLSYDTEVKIETGDLGDAYHVNLPVTGQLKTGSGADRVIATPSRAAIYRADRGSVLEGWGNDPCRMLAVKIDRRAVEEQLELLVDKPIRAPIAFELALDITSGHGHQWWAVLQALADQLRNADSLYRHPLLVAPLTQSVIVALLLAARHDYSAQLAAAVDPAAPAAVEHAKQYIEAHIDEPLTAVEIAAAVGVSLRALQHGFQTSLQTTPMRYLRDLRLRRVRAELLAADPEQTGVAEIAYRWGFNHLGRFAGQYRKMFGESPSEALRSGPHRALSTRGALYYTGGS
ncbi:AraC family transcriptional regulator [Rhodococcus erythropolis]|uniref:AraC family transcriptional regulator n=1 Tax=Rhodococcus erythropolis TaxID=1833 RepID=A0A8I1D6X1_RHOER|nr:AraC family transcriptional regulator [Rhodococcus erythropolis]MBH5143461.1 AraC family transcriptional regulator [Rhodococcus erythropolis]